MAISIDKQAVLATFYEDVERKSLLPLWRAGNSVLTPQPDARVRPYMWRWRLLRERMLQAGELMPVGGDGAERRVLVMKNPSMEGRVATTSTLLTAVQLVYPGEEAPSHRHTAAALRFIIEDDGAYTIVNGEPLSMEPGDFLLTPSWTWHGHSHDGSGPMLWLDVLDVPLIRGMDWMFFEEFAEPKQIQPPEKPRDDSLHRYGAGSLLPSRMGRPETAYSPLFSYKWAATRAALAQLADSASDPHDGVALDYTNPFTGGPVMPTIGASTHLLPAGLHTRAHRHAYSAVYHVAEGRGCSIIDGIRFDWERGDTFCVPTWCWHEHAASANESAVLFSASDAPVLQALDVNREQAYAENGGHQAITGVFQE